MALFGPPNVEKMKARGDAVGLIKVLGNFKDTGLRVAAAAALGEIGDAYAVEPLIAAFKDSDEGVRNGAIDALGKIGNPAVTPLITSLGHPDTNVSVSASKALGKIGSPAVEPLIAVFRKSDKPSWVAAFTAITLHRIGAPAVEPLIAALNDTNRDVRWGATVALSLIRDVRAVGPLIAALKDRDETVRGVAAVALADTGSPAVEALIVALKDSDRYVREGATKALKEIKDVRAKAALDAAAPSPELKVSRLVHDLRHGDGDAAYRAVNELGQLRDTDANAAVELLLDVVGDEGMRGRFRSLKSTERWREGDAGLLLVELTKRVLTSRGLLH